MQPLSNSDTDATNRHSTTTQPYFVSNPRTISTQPSHIRDGSFINCLGRRVTSCTTRDAKDITKLLAMLP